MAPYTNEVQELLQQRADLSARLSLLPYDGTPEIKEQADGQYLYVRKRVGSRLTSTYVDKYSDQLYQLLLRDARERREINRNIRRIDKRLAEIGYEESVLPPQVMLNIDLARANMKVSIYDQAVLEGLATTFPQTEQILENGRISGMRPSDIQKILNLKHAWQFVVDPDVLAFPSDYYILSHIARLVNEGFMENGGRIRGVPVTIGGTSYVPPLPIEYEVRDRIIMIRETSGEPIDTAIQLCLYCMKAQIFNDGNKRSSVIFANHYLISHGGGMLVIPEKEVPEFKELLVAYYEDRDQGEIQQFMKDRCWKKLEYTKE